MKNLCVVFINLTCTPKTPIFRSPLFLGEHGRSPPGKRHGCPFDGLKKAGGSKGTRPLGRPLGLAGFRLHPAPEADASGFIFRLYAGAATSGSAGGGQPPELVQATAWGEAPRLYSCFRSLLLFQRPLGDFVNKLGTVCFMDYHPISAVVKSRRESGKDCGAVEGQKVSGCAAALRR